MYEEVGLYGYTRCALKLSPESCMPIKYGFEDEGDKAKVIGQVFTPDRLVEEMLDYMGYSGQEILGKHVIDNSCGDGAFLKAVVRRYCKAAKERGLPAAKIRGGLEILVHGIDIDEEVVQKCEESLSRVAGEFGVYNVVWDLYCQSAFSPVMEKFAGKMSYVVGNPPYVRTHNLGALRDEIKKYKFTEGGMTDLYLAFFELGFNMLNQWGKMCYITSSSWLSSVAANNMRQYVMANKNLAMFVDLGHYQAFSGATTYTAISLFEKKRKTTDFEFCTFDPDLCKKVYVDRLSLDDCYIGPYFYMGKKKDLKRLRDIKTMPVVKYVSAKNGFATLADSVFIGDGIPQSDITIDVLKASTGKWSRCLFPYDTEGRLLPPKTVFENPDVRDYFEAHKDELLKGQPEYPAYYGFGRTQAIRDVWKRKLAVSPLLRTEKDVKVGFVDEGKGVYSGLYIIPNQPNVRLKEVADILRDKDFATYVSLLRKYKSGGYYTFNSKDLEQYVNYCLYYEHP